PLTNEETTLIDLADAVSIVLGQVDPARLGTLNQDMDTLRREEEEIIRQLDDLEAGLPVLAGPEFSPLVPSEDLGPEALERERALLTAQEAEIFDLERRRRAQAESDRALEAARQPSVLSRALLVSLHPLPSILEPVDEVVLVSNSQYPERLARALFRTGDFRGALRHFRQIDAASLLARDSYDMARCLEELGEIEEAIAILDVANANAAGREGDFWLNRIRSLKTFLDESRTVGALLREKEREQP
ncbi:MAG: CDC27 family protein, partial [Salinibacterium sp.]|nr:CDC27 family protein [Salinibacterium sp.]